MAEESPVLLLPYQIKWHEDSSQVRIAEKSRRIGWSWSAACESVVEAASTNGCDTWYVGYNHEMAQEFIRDCAWWSQVVGEAAVTEQSVITDEDKDILAYAIRFASGFRITALSSRPTNLRGKRGRIIIDEAAFHSDLPGLIKAAMAVLMWGGRSRVDIVSTHNGVDNYFNTLLEETRAGKRPYSIHRCTLKEALEQGLFKRICLMNRWEWSAEAEARWEQDLRRLYGDDADEELDCVPSRSGGTYIHRNLVERAMREALVARLEVPDEFVTWDEASRTKHVDQWCDELLRPALEALPKDRLHFAGGDFGRVSDRTVLAVGHLAQDLTRVYPFVVEMLNVPYDQQKQVYFYVMDRLPKFIGGALDATGNGGYLAEACAMRYGQLDRGTGEMTNKVEGISMTTKWYADNLPKLRAAFEDELMEIPRDADHMLDLSALKVINGVPTLPKAKTKTTKDGPLRHGDAAIAYALAHYASQFQVEAYDYQSPNRKPAIYKPGRAYAPVAGGGFKRARGGIL